MSTANFLYECDFVQPALKRPHTELFCVSEGLRHFARFVQLCDLPRTSKFMREKIASA